mmetsp:Transcript_22058/g.54156  ORF Transcript_22058/g.54156 Transcript_22058/m.54156 type:complete len:401 (+) Transcript_22058:1762-2964(+)
MFLEEEQRGLEVGVVVLVWNAPTKWPELPPLLHHAVQEGQAECRETPPLVVHFVERLLQDHRAVGAVQPCLEAQRWFVGDLDRHLEQTNGEARGRLASHPQPEVLVDIGHLAEEALDLGHEAQPQVAVLQYHPCAVDEAILHLFPCDDLLPLAHGDFVCGEFLLLLGELVDGVGGVGAGREQVQDGYAVGRLLPDGLDAVGHRRCVLRVHLSVDEHAGSHHCAVLAEGADETQSGEVADVLLHGESLLVVWHGAALGLVLLEPLLPRLFVAADEVGELSEEEQLLLAEGVTGQLEDVEPHLGVLAKPFERARTLGLLVKGASALEKDVDVGRCECGCDQHDLEGHHEDKRPLVALKQTAVHITIYLVGEVLNNLLHALVGGLHLLRAIDGDVKLLQELVE